MLFILSPAHVANIEGGPYFLIRLGMCCAKCSVGFDFILGSQYLLRCSRYVFKLASKLASFCESNSWDIINFIMETNKLDVSARIVSLGVFSTLQLQ